MNKKMPHVTNVHEMKNILDAKFNSFVPNNVTNAMARCDNTSLQIKSNKTDELLKEYNRHLIKIGYGMSRKDLKKKDIIDMRSILTTDESLVKAPDSTLSLEEILFGKENFWYHLIPCFTEGVLWINTCRYIYWNILELKPYENEMKIMLQDYIFYPDTLWNPGVKCNMRMILDPSIKKMRIELQNDIFLYSDIYQIIDCKSELKWSDYDLKIWEDVIIQFAVKTEKALEEKNTNNALELAKLFANYITKVNYMLYTNKPSTKRNKPSGNKVVMVNASNDDNNVQKSDNRRYRTIGGLCVTSKDIPKMPTQKTVMKYKVASWKTRGFIRTLPNGKKVHVRESIHHRKCLQDTNTAPVTIKLKPNEVTKDESNK